MKLKMMESELFQEMRETFATNPKHKSDCQVTEKVSELFGKLGFHKTWVSLPADLQYEEEDMQTLQFWPRRSKRDSFVWNI